MRGAALLLGHNEACRKGAQVFKLPSWFLPLYWLLPSPFQPLSSTLKSLSRSKEEAAS